MIILYRPTGGITTGGIWCLTIFPWLMTTVGLVLMGFGHVGAINMVLGSGIFALFATGFAAACSFVDWHVRRGMAKIDDPRNRDHCNGSCRDES